MKTNRIITIASLLILLAMAACGEYEKYEGYTQINDELHIKLVSLEKNDNQPEANGYVVARWTLRTMDDSVLFAGRKTMKMAPEGEGFVEDALYRMYKGDSAELIMNAKLFYAQNMKEEMPAILAENTYMRAGVKIIRAQSEKDYKRDLEKLMAWAESEVLFEKTLIKHYLEDENIKSGMSESGLYFISQENGHGPVVAQWDTVTIDYEGFFLDGRIFDSTKKRGEPFSFVLGHEMQVIPGLEEAISMMREGEKALVVMPSGMAFGQDGNSNGLVPAHTPVVYEIELLKINASDEDFINANEDENEDDD